VVNYHVDIPAADPLANTGSQDRLDYYSANSAPQVFVDGLPIPSLGGYQGAGSAKFDVLKEAIEKRLAAKPEAEVTLGATRGDGSTLRLHCNLAKAPARKGLVLRLALVEGTVRYSALNGIHFHHAVLRDLLDDVGLDSAEAGGPVSVDRSIDLIALKNRCATESSATRHEKLANGPLADILTGENLDLRVDDLAVVAFVQDDDTKEILQSAYIKVK
jgi:hypothetical protein